MTILNEHTLFKAQAPVAKTMLDVTSRNARDIVHKEAAARSEKTERLRMARLQRQADERAAQV